MNRIRCRAQSANNAAMLIAIIMGLILLYILFISPEERDKLLSDDSDSSSSSSSTYSNQTWRLNWTLVDETPGRLDYIKTNTIDHSIPSINLFSVVNSAVLKKVDNIYVKNGIFGYQKYSMDFFIEDTSLASNMLLTFNIKSGSGNLLVWFNGNLVYNNEVKNLNGPISLPKDQLKNDNKIDFWVSDVSWVFWKKNEYTLSDVKVIGDVKDISKTQALAKVWISSEEKNNIDKVTLKFSPECETSTMGTLTIMINGNNVYSGIPDCKILNSYDFSGDRLVSGENTMSYALSDGKVLIDRMTLTSKLKELVYPTYYFELDQTIIDNIKKGRQTINFTVTFTNNVDFKKVDFFINAMPSVFQTYGGSYTENISRGVQVGTNTLEIRPEKTSMDIPSLKIQTFTKKGYW